VAVALDSSTPAFVTGTANPVTTAAFSPPAGSLLVAFCLADESNTFAVSGGGLTWTKIDQLQTATGSAVNSLTSWWAYTPSALTNITVSSTRTGSFTANALKVLVFTGAETTFTGAHNAVSSNTVTLTGTQTGSWMWAAVGDNLGSTSDAAGSGCTWNDAETVFGGVSGGVLKRTSQDGANGSGTTLSAGTAPSNMSIAAVEVKAASSSVSPPPFRPTPPGLTPFGRPSPWQGTGTTPTVTQAAAATLAGAGSLTAGGTLTQFAAATLAGAGTLTAGAVDTTFGAASLTGTGGLTAGAAVTTPGAATLSGTGSLTAAGTLTQFAAASLSGAGSLTSAATDTTAGSATLAGSGTLTSSAALLTAAAATLAATGSLSASGAIQRGAAATLAGVGTLAVAVDISGIALDLAVTVATLNVAAVVDAGPMLAVTAYTLDSTATLDGGPTLTFTISTLSAAQPSVATLTLAAPAVSTLDASADTRGT